MPTYDYRCTDGHTFEVFQSITDDALTECEICGKPVQRVLHAPAVHFKGSGFYTTDYARKGSKPASTSDSSKNGDSKSSDSKPESKSKPEKSSSSSD